LLPLSLLLPLIPAFALEAHPDGVVLWFKAGTGEELRRCFSYFDLTPFGYGQWGAMLTVVCTCVLAALALVWAVQPRWGLGKGAFWLALVAAAASLSPVLYGTRSLTWINAAVAALLLLEAGLALLLQRSAARGDL
jgi:hypothetical protein